MEIGLIIIGDEIMSGSRTDAHFANVTAILAERGLTLTWARYLGDDRNRIVRTLKETFASDAIVFCCGGIGSTPDDHTRQAAAEALGRPLVLHPQAKALINLRILEVAEDKNNPDYSSPDNVRRLMMGEFPEGASIILNPVNHFPGFSVGNHHFVPGFPQMAKGMITNVLDEKYSHLFFSQTSVSKGVRVYGLMEAKMTPVMEEIEKTFPGVKVSSLPHMGREENERYVDVSVRAKASDADTVDKAFSYLMEAVKASGKRSELL